MINKIKNNIWQLHFKKFGSCVYLIKIKEKNILIDTSSLENKKELLKGLSELGITPEKINIILLTHGHWDHTSNVDLFEKAKIYNETNNHAMSPLKEI